MTTATTDNNRTLSPNHPDDPFINAVPHTQSSPHRYASFDNQVFSLYNSGSPAQAKRALEAHLKDTERRIQDASKLGTTLVQQQRDLAARLKEIEQAPSEEITPELQKKLDQLEKDYTEIGKESARAFLPKSRIVSTDFANNGPPSPAVFANHALPSPTKPTVNSRKQRNQPANRVHDIEFATEISTSLLAQVRQLQAVLSEKENALKDATAHKEQLEADMAGLMQRLRALDESEQKCKDENWNLETQMQDLTAQLKTATDHEQRLTQQLKFAQAEKDGAERELEDLKAAHGKLSDDHETIKKHHEAELFCLRRDVTGHESARDALVKKVDELTAQNTQLAKAVAARWQADGQMQDNDASGNKDRNGGDVETPDVSPQNSPIKPTPRHGMLETETLKSSLTHAHRMIQNLKNTVHREKTEKFELKRMLQDARDELESRRGEGGAGLSAHKKRRSDDSGVKFKKPQRLGPTRTTQQEIIMDDEDWEDQSIDSPSRPAPRSLVIPSGGIPFGRPTLQTADSTDAFETANERDTTDAFETANEDDVLTTTEPESAFQTGAEDVHGDSSDQLTETETGFRPSRRSISSRPSSRPGPLPNTKPENRNSFMSTASASGDEFENVRTPVQAQQPKYKLRLSRGARNSGSARNSAIFGGDFADSPASMSSAQQTPMNHGQSLGDELNGLTDASDSGEETADEGDVTFVPSSPEAVNKSVVSEATSVEHTAKPTMVDSAMMTEPWEPEHKSMVGAAAGALGSAVAGVAGFALGSATGHENWDKKEAEISTSLPTSASNPLLPGRFVESEPSSTDPSPKHYAPDTSATEDATFVQPIVKQPETLALSTVSTAHTEPQPVVQAVKEPEKLKLSSFAVSHTEPQSVMQAVKEPEKLTLSSFAVSHTEPVVVAPKIKEPEKFSLSQYPATYTAPIAAVPEVKKPAPFSIAAFPAAYTEPVAPEIQMPQSEPLAVSPFKSTSTEPYFPPQLDPVMTSPFTISPLTSTHMEPYFPPQPEQVKAPRLAMTRGTSTQVEPVAPVVDEVKDTLGFSTVRSQQWQPEKSEDVCIAGTDRSRPAGAFLASLNGQFPPRTSSRDRSHVEPKSVQEPRMLGGIKGANLEEPTLVFADENILSPHTDMNDQFRQPFAEVSNNAGSSVRSISNDGARPAVKRSYTSETGTQTVVSSDEIDKMMRRKTPMQIPAVNVNESSPIKPGSPRRASETPFVPEGANIKTLRRPASSGSMRKTGTTSPPPLPNDHTQRIAAAAAQKSLSPPMGPPAMPASAYGKAPPSLRSRTPSISKSVQSVRGTMNRPMAPIPARAEPMSSMSRTESISSFASELDERFQIRQNGMIYPEDVLPSTDPRMIQAITQTMIGEYLWKYTRKAGRSEISASRHRRFFWVHPYTRTLYWSEHDPSTMGKQQSKAKSVAIEAIRVITDDNAYPPGLYRKSLVIITPGREIVFTAPTAQRHDTWFNALSYLLLRTGPERENDEISREEVDEFNPQMRSTSRNTARTRMSLSSYNSRATGRTSSPRRQHASEVPSLANRPSQAASLRLGARTPGSADGSNRPSIMGGLFKSPGNSLRGSFSSKRSKSAMSHRRPIEPAIYDASVIEDSTDDLRAVIEGQERDLGRLENVRACCDGKHDVGSLSRSMGRHTMGHTHGHTHAEPSTISSRRPR